MRQLLLQLIPRIEVHPERVNIAIRVDALAALGGAPGRNRMSWCSLYRPSSPEPTVRCA